MPVAAINLCSIGSMLRLCVAVKGGGILARRTFHSRVAWLHAVKAWRGLQPVMKKEKKRHLHGG